jgi:hypothetical protein
LEPAGPAPTIMTSASIVVYSRGYKNNFLYLKYALKQCFTGHFYGGYRCTLLFYGQNQLK